MDEPTAALGVAQTGMVLDLIKTLSDQGVTVLLVSHNLNTSSRWPTVSRSSISAAWSLSVLRRASTPRSCRLHDDRTLDSLSGDERAADLQN